MEKQRNRLAKARIDAVVYELKHTYSDFIYPLSRLKWEERTENGGECLATDGMTIYYEPDLVLRAHKESLKYSILHIIMHGLMGHFQIKDDYKEKTYRDILMDVQVAYLLDRLQVHWEQGQFLVERFGRLFRNDFSMGQYYKMARNKELITNLAYYRRCSKVDEHAEWDEKAGSKAQLVIFWKDIQGVVLGEAAEELEAVVLLVDEDGKTQGMGVGSDKSGNREGNGTDEDETDKKDRNERLEKLAKVLAGKFMVFGTGSSGAEGTFEVEKAGTQNYEELLEELFQVREVSREEPDSIDPMFYSYGLDLYEDVPLIEPVEISEKPSFHALAIAIDVSGSCTTDSVMKSFWGETYECIRQLKERHAEGEIILFQCDDRIQREQRLELDEFSKVPQGVNIIGMGGTSFVPVFERLEQLQEEGTSVDALIYLTDGCGYYPKKEPDYPVYFVMPQEDEEMSMWRIEMPDWINKVRL